MAESALLLRCKSGSSYAESNNKCIAGERRAKGFVATDYTLHTLREMHSKSVEEERRKEGWASAVVDGGTIRVRICVFGREELSFSFPHSNHVWYGLFLRGEYPGTHTRSLLLEFGSASNEIFYKDQRRCSLAFFVHIRKGTFA